METCIKHCLILLILVIIILKLKSTSNYNSLIRKLMTKKISYRVLNIIENTTVI